MLSAEPKAEADNTYRDLDYLGYHKNRISQLFCYILFLRHIVAQSRPRALLRMWRREIKSSGEPWSRIVSDWFQQKKKVFLIGPFKFARERLNVLRVWRVSGVFPRNVEVNTTGRLLISAIPKQHFHD